MRTKIIPAQTLLGASAPMPGPVAIASLGMTEQKVLACGRRRLVLQGGRERGIRRGDASIFYRRQATPRQRNVYLLKGS